MKLGILRSVFQRGCSRSGTVEEIAGWGFEMFTLPHTSEREAKDWIAGSQMFGLGREIQTSMRLSGRERQAAHAASRLRPRHQSYINTYVLPLGFRDFGRLWQAADLLPSEMRGIRTVRNNTGTRQHPPPRRRAQGDGAGGRSLGGPQPASSAEYLYKARVHRASCREARRKRQGRATPVEWLCSETGTGYGGWLHS